MKTNKKALKIFASFLICLALWSFYGIHYDVMLAPDSIGSNQFKFPIDTSKLADLHGGVNPNYRFVLYHGDGTYFMGTEAELAAHTYNYSNVPLLHNPCMEIIARYDDGGIPPARTAAYNLPINSSASPVIQPTIPMTGRILLTSTCSPVPGDSITYIVTIDLTEVCEGASNLGGSVTLTYNPNVFEQKGMSPNYSLYNNYQPTIVYSAGSIVYPLTGIPTGKQYTLYFLLETKQSATTNDLPNVSAILNLNNGQRECIAPETSTIAGEVVRDSHDPNYKELVSHDKCDENGKIKWRIHFQNEGSAPEDSIYITDWIDPMLDLDETTITHWPGRKKAWKRNGERTINCLIDSINLRGLGERGVNVEDTRDYIELETSKNQFEACIPYINRARIRFDSKPPIETADLVIPAPCYSCEDSCIIVFDTTLAWRPTIIGDTLFSASMASMPLFNLLKSANFVKWYPSDGLSNPFVLNPSINKQVRRTYTLVASFDNCKSMIIRVPVGPACNISFAETNSCNRSFTNPIWSINVAAEGASPANLMWHNGVTGVGSFSKNGLAPGIIYVGVWDTLTGCSAEKWIRLADKCSPYRPKTPVELIGIAAFLAIIGYILYKIFKNK